MHAIVWKVFLANYVLRPRDRSCLLHCCPCPLLLALAGVRRLPCLSSRPDPSFLRNESASYLDPFVRFVRYLPFVPALFPEGPLLSRSAY